MRRGLSLLVMLLVVACDTPTTTEPSAVSTATRTPSLTATLTPTASPTAAPTSTPIGGMSARVVVSSFREVSLQPGFPTRAFLEATLTELAGIGARIDSLTVSVFDAFGNAPPDRFVFGPGDLGAGRIPGGSTLRIDFSVAINTYPYDDYDYTLEFALTDDLGNHLTATYHVVLNRGRIAELEFDRRGSNLESGGTLSCQLVHLERTLSSRPRSQSC